MTAPFTLAGRTQSKFAPRRYNILEQLSPNSRMNGYSLDAFLTNAPHQLNALAPGGYLGLDYATFSPSTFGDQRFQPTSSQYRPAL
jgi:hypothetical protein